MGWAGANSDNYINTILPSRLRREVVRLPVGLMHTYRTIYLVETHIT